MEDLKRVNIKDEYTVVGYIRNESIQDIPYGIIQICILFFVCFEQWSQQYKGNRITINGSIATITVGPTGSSTSLQSIVGQNVIKQSGIHHWKFKILEIKSTVYWKLVMGIVNVDNVNDDTLKNWMKTYLSAWDSKVYIYITTYGSKETVEGGRKMQNCDKTATRSDSYGIHCDDGYIIDMYFDLDEAKLAFCVNNKYQGIAFKNIKGREWRMGASMSGTETSLQLVSYEQLNEFPY